MYTYDVGTTTSESVGKIPEDAMKMKVYAPMWDWSFEYANRKRSEEKVQMIVDFLKNYK